MRSSEFLQKRISMVGELLLLLLLLTLLRNDLVRLQSRWRQLELVSVSCLLPPTHHLILCYCHTGSLTNLRRHITRRTYSFSFSPPGSNCRQLTALQVLTERTDISRSAKIERIEYPLPRIFSIALGVNALFKLLNVFAASVIMVGEDEVVKSCFALSR